MSKVIGPPQSGRVGNVVYRVTCTGLVASQYVVPRNPQLPKQQLGRATFGMVSGHWRQLSPEDQEAWCLGGADPYTISRLGRTTPLPCYGVPPVGKAILIRTRQHIDGWMDSPIVTRAIVRPG